MIDLRVAARQIFDAGVASVNPYAAVRRFLTRDRDCLHVGSTTGGIRDLDLGRYRRVVLVGCGKAGAPMAAAVGDVLGDRLTRGVVTVKHGHGGGLTCGRIQVFEAGHPTPDEAGVLAASCAGQILDSVEEGDLTIAIVSGGGSALWPLPAKGISLSDKMRATALLLSCGADIVEMNCVRKHLSAIKGGLAARRASRGETIVLVMSDVIGSPLDVIASGPFSPDPTDFGQALSVLERYAVVDQTPSAVIDRLRLGSNAEIEDTPGTGDACFSKVEHVLVATNELALQAASETARCLGFEPHILTSSLAGDVSVAVSWLGAQVRTLQAGMSRPTCLLCGGETTVSLGKSSGKGGRNQEFALRFAVEMQDVDGVTLLSCGTDGTDGPTDAAGAIVDQKTMEQAGRKGLDVSSVLADHDSYHFFEALGDLVVTGPTQTNVMDMQVALMVP